MHELNQFHATKFFQSKVNLISTQRISLRVDCQMSSAAAWAKMQIEFNSDFFFLVSSLEMMHKILNFP